MLIIAKIITGYNIGVDECSLLTLDPVGQVWNCAVLFIKEGKVLTRDSRIFSNSKEKTQMKTDYLLTSNSSEQGRSFQICLDVLEEV